METNLDLHCLAVLGKLARGEITYLEAGFEIDSHGDGLLQGIIEHGFCVNYSNLTHA